MLKRASDKYGFDIEWRPVVRTHFGRRIERLLGTFAKEIHTLPGTTFSNTRERGDYGSESKAAMSWTLGSEGTWGLCSTPPNQSTLQTRPSSGNSLIFGIALRIPAPFSSD
ncbi:hypothetical protein [Paludibacterium purpuratum]|uniref:hypothetical protein n=1 Tax=Paludibacterium purpuratum TaxID=1144873 RepID=UPI00105BBF98|nr:hypothetical protein [Paludibacterium purpuratum]